MVGICMYFYQVIKTIYKTWNNKQYLHWYVIDKNEISKTEEKQTEKY